MIVAIDPGLHTCGVSIWMTNGQLLCAKLINETESIAEDVLAFVVDAGIRVDDVNKETVVIEKPQIYRWSKGDPNDLIDLAVVVGQLQTIFRNFRNAAIVIYRPAEWKGQVPKEVTKQRAIAQLSDEEREQVTLPHAKSLQHNVWDAVGLGLYHLKSTHRR